MEFSQGIRVASQITVVDFKETIHSSLNDHSLVVSVIHFQTLSNLSQETTKEDFLDNHNQDLEQDSQDSLFLDLRQGSQIDLKEVFQANRKVDFQASLKVEFQVNPKGDFQVNLKGDSEDKGDSKVLVSHPDRQEGASIVNHSHRTKVTSGRYSWTRLISTFCNSSTVPECSTCYLVVRLHCSSLTN